MQISKIKYKNDAILGNLSLDFTNSDGKIYKTIILAGENGTGKTRILDTLFDFLNLGPFTPFNEIEYTVNENDYYQISYDENESSDSGFHKRRNLNNSGNVEIIRTNRNTNKERLENDIADIRRYGVAYLSARSKFSTSKITTTDTRQIDSNKRISDREEDYTSIKQLMVNLNSQDNAKLANLVCNPENSNLNVAELKLKHETESSKLRRFIKAFNNFFSGGMVFDSIDEEDANEKNIYFRKGDSRIKIDDLSSGEKQIIFRGAKLLSDVSLVRKGIILIDEPELNLHPLWQDKILEYYQKLFEDPNNEQPQMIIATHSEYVVSQALEHPEDTLVIILKNENSRVVPEIASTRSDNFVLPLLSSSEVNYLAFNLPTTDYHVYLYGQVQKLLQDRVSINETDRRIKEYIDSHYEGDEKSELLRVWEYNGVRYETLSTYIRNAIDHPDSVENQESGEFDEKDLRSSIKLLRRILKDS